MSTAKRNATTNESLVAVGTSARLLVDCAHAAGIGVHALDVFGDVDTRRRALSWQPIGSGQGLKIDGTALEAALQRFAADPQVLGWVVGSGLEADPALLARCARRLPLLGNRPQTVAALRSPARFHALLAELEIAAPQICLHPPGEPQGWLFKDAHACGGWHVRAAARAPAHRGPGGYFQRHQAGEPMSLTLLADGRQWRSLMLARQLVGAPAPRPYGLRGGVGPLRLCAAAWARLERAADRLVAANGLIGLNGIDFLLDGEKVWLLEVNPRPVASLALFDTAAQGLLLRAHLAVCGGATVEQVALPPAMDGVRASEVVFARQPLTLSAEAAQWLAAQPHCRDLPAAGAKAAKGDPLCSVLASAADPELALALLQARREEVLARLGGTRPAARDADCLCPMRPAAAPFPIERARRAWQWACAMDVAVRKPGNVSRASAGHDMVAQQFIDSARASSAALLEPGAAVGTRLLQAVAATRAAVGCNTNLGILLLCAPLALALERAADASAHSLQQALEEVLAALDVADARAASAAIMLASPGGLGSTAEQDVAGEVSVGLRELMRLAADRDLIARQYASGHADVFAALESHFGADAAAQDAVIDRRVQRLFVDLLARHPDSHIVRKRGPELAATVQQQARQWRERLHADPQAGDGDAFAAWDEELKRCGLNPGTTADLTVCVLFLAALLEPALCEMGSAAVADRLERSLQ